MSKVPLRMRIYPQCGVYSGILDWQLEKHFHWLKFQIHHPPGVD